MDMTTDPRASGSLEKQGRIIGPAQLFADLTGNAGPARYICAKRYRSIHPQRGAVSAGAIPV